MHLQAASDPDTSDDETSESDSGTLGEGKRPQGEPSARARHHQKQHRQGMPAAPRLRRVAPSSVSLVAVASATAVDPGADKHHRASKCHPFIAAALFHCFVLLFQLYSTHMSLLFHGIRRKKGGIYSLEGIRGQ